ncbi:proton-dependent oligopeptide transporter, POT family [Saccharopolyspora antimicrobica]|uniref:POT family proton-dependent oligopeptide transporter n=1 Tax=Saccharopolyspora antimicrobica TaxID=455193 RepID=A0A1I5C0S5_9PSEU|nr:peptide MFS transporter [Saccharopolyspora antimicrobica]RKT89014.1 POT family proton-dependent oligopeptide transporter [Saccharopolyspora antimicrobica]SFN80506.1 proton-dependent oligopeptide transporter, POT family [Saccharopolyspora antimicrobica]
MSEQTKVSPNDRKFFGHPRGLATLFFLEMWERFSYYGMSAILLYYLYDRTSDGGLGLDKPTASALVSIYGALVFMSGIFGGWLADRVLGMRRAVLLGGLLIMCGHLALTVPGGLPALLVSMLLIVAGTGLLKPNVSSLVGELYSPTDNRRDAGFSLFYMGINLGAFLAPYLVGTLGQQIGYHLGFGLAAVGMAVGLVAYVRGRGRLGRAGDVPTNPLRAGERRQAGMRAAAGVAVLAVAVVALGVTGSLTVQTLINAVSVLAVLLPAAYLITMLRSPHTDAVERSRLIAYIPLFLGAVCYWVVNEQSGSVLAQFADTRTDLEIFGFAVPSSWFQSLNPIATLVLAPTFAWLWIRMGDRQPATPRKFAIGLLLGGASFVLMAGPGLLHGVDAPASPWWLVGSYFVVICGSMCLSPVGLSATTKLAPRAFLAQMMSLWFLASAAAEGINAQLVQFYRAETEVGYFAGVGAAVMGAGVVMHLMTPWVQRRMGGVR